LTIGAGESAASATGVEFEFYTFDGRSHAFFVWPAMPE
jgi:hypothetical protein